MADRFTPRFFACDVKVAAALPWRQMAISGRPDEICVEIEPTRFLSQKSGANAKKVKSTRMLNG